MALTTIHDRDINALLILQHGTRPVLQRYVKRAFDAGNRLKVAVANGNTEAALMEAQTMIENNEQVQMILADEKNAIAVELGNVSDPIAKPKKTAKKKTVA